MGALDTVSLTHSAGSALVLAGILSSLIALRFGAPLLLVFLLVGMAAGDMGLGIKFDDVRATYLVGSVALALILFDGGLRTRFTTFRSVLAPSLALATVGVLLTAVLTAPFAKFALGLSWTEALLTGAMVASTDAAAVFFLLHAHGLRLRPRVGATLEVESGTNDPFAIFLTLMLVELLLRGEEPWWLPLASLAGKGLGGAAVGFIGGRATVWALNRLGLAQGLHAPFVATSVLIVFSLSEALGASGFLAVYMAGLIVGNRPTRAHNIVVAFFDAATWLAQIVMFVLLGLLVWPDRLLLHLLPAFIVAFGLMAFARPAAVFAVFLSSVFRCASDGSFRGSDCAARSGFSWPRSRCWSASPTPSSISMSASWWCSFRSPPRVGPSPGPRTACTSPCRITIRRHAASSSTCPASWPRNLSVTASATTIRICAGT